MTEADKRLVLQLIGEAKEELRNEIRDDSNKHYDKGISLTNDLGETNEAIFDLAEVVGEVQEAMK